MFISKVVYQDLSPDFVGGLVIVTLRTLGFTWDLPIIFSCNCGIGKPVNLRDPQAYKMWKSSCSLKTIRNIFFSLQIQIYTSYQR